jgi:MFS family permease
MEDRHEVDALDVSHLHLNSDHNTHVKHRCITYMLQSIDKTTLSYAAVFNLREETHLVGTEYSWLGSLFYLGYLFWEYPTSLMLQRFPVAKFMSATVIIWGIVLMCHAAADDFAGLAAARTFLGIFEASINPGTMVIFSMWYKRSEQPFRMGIWVGSAGLGYVLAGIASFGIGHIGGSMSSWRYMFLIWGAVTTAWGDYFRNLSLHTADTLKVLSSFYCCPTILSRRSSLAKTSEEESFSAFATTRPVSRTRTSR